jgi:hypothetical protein
MARIFPSLGRFFLWVVITLVTMELVLAVFHPIPAAIEPTMSVIPDPYTGFRTEPNGVGHFRRGIPANANSHGHRDDEVAVKKDPGTYRIMVLGESFTLGTGVRQEEAYPQVLEKVINEHSPLRIEIINAAVDGWDPFQYAQYYEHYGRQFEPDMVLVGFFVGDDSYSPVAQVTEVMSRRVTRTEGPASPPLGVNLVRLLKSNSRSSDEARKSCDDFGAGYLDLQRERLANHVKLEPKQFFGAQNALTQIKRIKELAEKGSARFAVILIPDESQLNERLRDVLLGNKDRTPYDFGMPQLMLTALFRKNDIPTIDLLPFAQKDSRCLYMNDGQWTSEGHAMAASALVGPIRGLIGEAAAPVAILPLHIAFGTAAAREFMRDGWNQDERQGGETWVWSEGARSVLELSLPDDGDIRMNFEAAPLRVPDSPPQKVTVVLNGRPVKELTLGEGRQAYSILLPKAFLRDGVDVMELRYAFNRRPANGDARSLAVSWHSIDFIQPPR